MPSKFDRVSVFPKYATEAKMMETRLNVLQMEQDKDVTSDMVYMRGRTRPDIVRSDGRHVLDDSTDDQVGYVDVPIGSHVVLAKEDDRQQQDPADRPVAPMELH